MESILLLLFDIVNFGLLAFLWWFSIKNYKILPETIPIHFDFDGKADNFGSKKYFYLMPAVLTVIYFLFVLEFTILFFLAVMFNFLTNGLFSNQHMRKDMFCLVFGGVLVLLFAIDYGIYSFITFPLMIGYHAFALKRVFDLSWSQLILKLFLFLALMGVLMILFMVVMGIGMFLYMKQKNVV